tara:strand:+ start:902 stop:1462 length:561 start_codon:yes stop_codon:yes gene_type:complete
MNTKLFCIATVFVAIFSYGTLAIAQDHHDGHEHDHDAVSDDHDSPSESHDTHDHGHDDEYTFGKPGDSKKPARVVAVAMRELDDGTMAFTPKNLTVNQGEQIRFLLRNAGVLEHEFVLATEEENLEHAKEMEKNPDMEHDDPNARRLGPGETGEILWHFTKSGTYDFSCLIPGHRGLGMTGSVMVK